MKRLIHITAKILAAYFIALPILFGCHTVLHEHDRVENQGDGLSFKKQLILYPKGTTRPKIDGDIGPWYVEISVESVVANEDGEIARLKSLGLIDHIVGMGGGDIYDAELLMSAGADLPILHTYDESRLEGMQRLRKLGINAIPQFAWAEQHFLTKAKWIKFTSLLFNKEKEANDLFDAIEERCKELISEVKNQPSMIKSFLLYHPSSNGDWNAHRNDFYSSYLEAVGYNVLKDNGPTHSVGISSEKLLKEAKDADFWIMNNTTDADWPPGSYLNSFKAYREGNVYHYQKRTRYENNAYDWYETPEVRPDLVLEDLVSVFYPEMLPDHELVFFDKVKLTKQ